MQHNLVQLRDAMPMAPLRHVQIARFTGVGGASHEDDVAVEEPLAIRVDGETLAVTMRTPGHDKELALGFLWAEGIVTSLAQVADVVPCGGAAGAIDVRPKEGVHLALPSGGEARRGTLTTSACGVCGRRSIDDLLARCAKVAAGSTMRASAIRRAVEALRATQPIFTKSGGCHGASLVTLDGEHLATFEDVGRHNAVDKLVGALLLRGSLPASSSALVVSGRTSFELVQKAVAAGIPIVIGISAPSSLAIDVARSAGVTLIGFARGDAFVVYAGDERIVS